MKKKKKFYILIIILVAAVLGSASASFVLNSPESGSAISQKILSDKDGGNDSSKDSDKDSGKSSGKNDGKSSEGESAENGGDSEGVRYEVAELKMRENTAYLNGYPDGTIRPDKLLSREEAAAMWVRLMTDESRDAFATKENIYKDISKENWSYEDILLLSNAGMIEGYTSGKFKPYDPVTRAEFTVIGVRFALSHEKMPEEVPDQFFDVSGHWAADYINYAAKEGWLTGYDDGTFRPDAYITRAESTAYINRILEAASEITYKEWSDNDADAWYYNDIQRATN